MVTGNEQFIYIGLMCAGFAAKECMFANLL